VAVRIRTDKSEDPAVSKAQIYALAAIALLVSTIVLASHITMVTDYSVTDATDGLTLGVTTTNRGDETAYEVQFEVQIADQNFTSPSLPQLGVNETTSADFSVHDAFHLPGHYPVLVKVHYQDANKYPFTATSIGFYDFQHPALSKVMVRAEDASIPSDGEGTVKYSIRNNDSVKHDLTLTLHLPDELATLKYRDRLTIGPRQSKSLQYPVDNFSALENSGYAVALVAEYEDGKSHYSSAGSGTVRITGPDFPGGKIIWMVVAISGVVLLLAIISRLRRK